MGSLQSSLVPYISATVLMFHRKSSFAVLQYYTTDGIGCLEYSHCMERGCTVQYGLGIELGWKGGYTVPRQNRPETKCPRDKMLVRTKHLATERPWDKMSLGTKRLEGLNVLFRLYFIVHPKYIIFYFQWIKMPHTFSDSKVNFLLLTTSCIRHKFV